MQTLSSSSAWFSERERENSIVSAAFFWTHVLQGYERRNRLRTFRTLRPAAWPAPLHQPHGLTHQFTLSTQVGGTIGPRHSTEVLNVWKTSRQFEQTKKKKKKRKEEEDADGWIVIPLGSRFLPISSQTRTVSHMFLLTIEFCAPAAVLVAPVSKETGESGRKPSTFATSIWYIPIHSNIYIYIIDILYGYQPTPS